jgi:CubicO group peptidase (beta-lactamase class C family)
VKWTIPAVILLLLVPFCLAADKKEEKPKPAQSIDELRQQIEKILKDTHTNGVSIAIVHKGGSEWVTGLGMADLASNRPATADTLFRIGSTSKAFASLSILLRPIRANSRLKILFTSSLPMSGLKIVGNLRIRCAS